MCEEHSPYSNFIPEMFAKTGIKRRRMPFEWVAQIFEQAKVLGVKEIIPSTMGEPLLYKGFENIFKLSEQTGIKINLTTNGTFPKKSVEDWAELICPNTVDVKISWNGATKETAQKVMLNIDFDKAIENVKRFIKVRDKVFHETGKFCRVTFQLTFMKNNMHELPEIIKLAAELGVDRVKGHQLWDHFDEIKDLSFRKNEASIKEWNKIVARAIEAVEEFKKPDGSAVIIENIIPLKPFETNEVEGTYECPFLNKEIWISATGKYSPCCAPDDLRQSLGDFGNFKDKEISDVLKDKTYVNLVKNYKEKSLCKTCNMRKPK